MSKNSLKRNDKKSGRKKPRRNDYDKDIIPAPDSAAATENEVSEEPIKVKKIKLEEEEVDVDDSGKDWVHSLKLSHKETILHPKGWICSDVMNQSLYTNYCWSVSSYFWHQIRFVEM